MADKLTPQQYQAVHNRGGKLLVSAAAGSGKTKVLVDRLMTYLTDENDPADLDEFLIITYTKAAASELRGKIASKLTERIAQEPANRHLQKQMQRLFLTKISTVHGFCGDILREYAYRLDLPADFRIADENECKEIRQQVITDLLERAYTEQSDNEDFHTFVDSQGLGRSDKLIPEIIEKVYDSARCHLNPSAWLDSCLFASDTSDITDVSETLWGRFLLDELKEYLSIQIGIFESCCKKASEYPELDKVVQNLRNTLAQFQELHQAQTWDATVSLSNINWGRLVFPRKSPDQDLTDGIKAVRNACKKGLEKKLQHFTDDSSIVLQDLSQSSAGIRGLVTLVQQFDRGYTSVKKTRRCLDFGDLEHKTLDLLLGKSRSGPTAAATEIGRRFREIMVDEYQDSNSVQDAIFDALTAERQNCFLVGDVKQSIYQFRLADPGIFLDKYHRYLPAETAQPGHGRKVLLSHNFRSGCEIVEGVNDVFYNCMGPRVGGLAYTENEALREGIPHEPLPDPAVSFYAIDVQEEAYPEEAAFVAQQIYTMLQQGTLVRKDNTLKPVTADDIVILLRSPGSAAGYFQRALEARGIRCSSGGGKDLMQTQEIAAIRSFLETILNPRQDIPLLGIMASPVFAFTADELAAIRSKQKKGSFYDAILQDNSPKTLDFLNTLTVLRKEAQLQPLSVLLEKCFSLTRMDSIYASMEGGEAKAANLQQFYELALSFEQGSVRDLAQFLEHLKALEAKGVPNNAVSTSGCVTLMSIHKSKGLEFPVVFLCNLSRKFNQESLRAQVLCHKDLGLGLSIADNVRRIRYPSVAKRAIAEKIASESLSEEMRVLYVALTRPRDRLIMTYASRSLESDIADIVLRTDLDQGELLCREAACPGDWVLQCVIKKTEAGNLHAIGGRPGATSLSAHPWNIAVVQADVSDGEALQPTQTEETLAPEVLAHLKKSLSHVYPHLAATTAPSKQTATGRKGRSKDEEAAEHTTHSQSAPRSWRKPSFVSTQADGRAYGNALHHAMQYIRFGACGSLDSIREEITRMLHANLLTADEASLIDCEGLYQFFQTDYGQRLVHGADCIREFKFSILDNGSHYGQGLEEEQILLQGVVDCAILEEDGIVILDFKSDRISSQNLESAVRRYTPQLEAYAHALSRIYGKRVKEKLLYFFHLHTFVSV